MKRTDRFRDLLQIAGAVFILFWRACSCPPATLWRDWIALIAVGWIIAVFGGRSRIGLMAAALISAYLLVIYALGQAPQTLLILGLSP